ncbi:hypothetical protein PAAG_03439 [Paracoccidioides lutzii Pb01]|uniref:Uncharacterized protein n=1 Tax=Paracoccidioides lutzii (strain ATCC MYA-826 / Pb01) TaxID=502779 RepID=C1GX65_PARBA|nr:hypothetical protein PAAG_03439 [Paracoccidioides lutzii Pb01]EEH41153.2 hypothetical protein PAAG_03439 [Paracoccidioides lutzii Pb01]
MPAGSPFVMTAEQIAKICQDAVSNALATFSNDAEVIGDSDILLKRGKILQSFVRKVRTSIGTLELDSAPLLWEKVKPVYAVSLAEKYLSNGKEDIVHDSSLFGLKDFQKALILTLKPELLITLRNPMNTPEIPLLRQWDPKRTLKSMIQLRYDRSSQPIEQTSSPIIKILAQWHVDQGHIRVDAIIALAKALDLGVRIKGLKSKHLDTMI